MRYGIPEYRLDRELLTAELNSIVDLGVEVHLNTKLGTDVTFSELQRRHDALFLAIGASLGRGLDIEGHQADGVLKAIEFLINVNQGFEVEVGEKVVVIGGGDTAIDAARVSKRLGADLHIFTTVGPVQEFGSGKNIAGILARHA